MVKKPIFGPKELRAWNDDIETLMPPSATEAQWPEFADVVSFRGQALSVGAVLRLRNRDATITDIRLNPVMARELGHWLLEMGNRAGWLNDRYEVISPLAELDG